jgi:hypothetical protein
MDHVPDLEYLSNEEIINNMRSAAAGYKQLAKADPQQAILYLQESKFWETEANFYEKLWGKK